MPTAFVTGGSSGIGAAYCRRLAKSGHDLVLTARRRDRLETMALDLRARYGVAVDVLAADLSRDAEVADLETYIGHVRELTMLVNAAGFVTAGDFAELPVTSHLDMLRVHVEAPVRLTHAGLPALLASRGAVVNVASIGAFLPTAGNASYAGTKAFLVAWTRALHAELRGTGVRVQALCPGFTRTEIYETPELRPLALAAKIPPFLWRSPDAVVDASLHALARDRVICIPGLAARSMVLAGSIGLLPIFSGFVQRATSRTNAYGPGR